MNLERLKEQIKFFAYGCARYHGAEIEKIEITFKKMMKPLKFNIADELKNEE